MIALFVPITILWTLCKAEDYFYQAPNVTRTTLSRIEAYRSDLTLDWLAAEDMRQRELVAAFETEASPPHRIYSSDCISYARPASGKVARLMLELLKNLEGDDGMLVTDLINTLIRAKLLVETSMLNSEPDLESLVKTPSVMMGEPHVTFPRILAMLWMTVTDPVVTKKSGWCTFKKVNGYISATRPNAIAKHMRALDPVIARARFIMEEFIGHVTPLHVFHKSTKALTLPNPKSVGDKRRQTQVSTQPPVKPFVARTAHILLAKADTTASPQIPAEDEELAIRASSPTLQACRLLFMCLLLVCLL